MVTFLRACASSNDHLEVSPAFLQFFAVESFHNFAFLRTVMEKEPRHHLVQNCLHSTFALEQLPIHFLRVSCTSVSDVFFLNNLPDSLRWDKVDDFVSHFLNVFWWILVLGLINFQCWKMHLFNRRRAPNKRRVRINAGSTRPSFK